jgi:hypothetical protein
VFDGFRPNHDIADREIWVETAGSADTATVAALGNRLMRYCARSAYCAFP